MIGTMWRFSIATVGAGRTRGRIGICSCPGWALAPILGGASGGDFQRDFETILHWNPQTVITLLQPFELRQRGIEQVGLMLQARGIGWLHLPIAPGELPQRGFDEQWELVSERLKESLRAGGKILIHSLDSCRRAALVAARLLVEVGCRPQDAVNRVMAARPGSMRTEEHREYILAVAAERNAASFWTPSGMDAGAADRDIGVPMQARLPLGERTVEVFNPRSRSGESVPVAMAAYRPLRDIRPPRSSP